MGQNSDEFHGIEALESVQDSRSGYNNLFINIPHSSTAFPEGSPNSFADLDDEERLLIDYYTDEMFIPDKRYDQIGMAIFPYCRLFCDVERLINDPLEKKGLGISYARQIQTGNHHSFTVRSFSTRQEAFRHYANYHAAASSKLFCLGDGTLLIDCHSFSNLPNLLNPSPTDTDICIGYNDDETCPSKLIISDIVHYFKSLGYKVGINNPFSNSKTFDVPVAYHSIMIEVNKRLYMNELTLEKTEGFRRLRKEIQILYERLLN